MKFSLESIYVSFKLMNSVLLSLFGHSIWRNMISGIAKVYIWHSNSFVAFKLALCALKLMDNIHFSFITNFL